MITYINTKNREKYQVLFDKAERTLLAAAESGNLPAGIDINTLEISTLNQYFAYLKDLISVSSSEDIKRYFTRLPLDEDFFEINANTRAISVPRSFVSNGVGVQGDETAEIIYFTIDRYFDSTDLANEDIKIVIQWEARNKNREVITGISPNYGKDLETIPGKIIFGWPIYSELTEAAGTIKFAVRFFSLGEPDESGVRSLNYSLSTLPAEVSVGSTLNYDLIEKSLQEIDRGKVITGRIKNSGVNDPSVPTPGLPVITTSLRAIGNDTDMRIVDLPIDNSGRKLEISARPADFGAILYDWKQWPYDTVTGEYSNTSTSLTSGIDNGVYEEVTSDLGDDTYYRITSAVGASPVVYSPISVEDYLADTTYDVDEGGFETAEGSYVKLYKKLSVATVNQVGIYTVNVGARNGVNLVTKTMNIADGIKIPGPLKPIVAPPAAGENVSVTDDDVTHIITNNGTAVLTANAVIGEQDKEASEVGTNPQVTLSYKWKKKADNVISDIDIANEQYNFNEDKSRMTISDLPENGLDETYFVEVTATRNGISTVKNSEDYRITNTPIKPVLKYRELIGGTLKQVIKDYTTETSALPISMRTKAGAYNKIAFSVEAPALSDNLAYVWMRINIEDIPSDWGGPEERPVAKLQIDIDNLLPDLFEDLTGNPDIAVDGAFGLTTLTELGEVVDSADNGPALQLNEETPTGYYYCIVINELNNNRVANVSPFFHVTE